MKEINYLKGDATEPIIKEGLRIIPHICNDIGAWGKGFVMALSNKWKEPESEYRLLGGSRKNRIPLGITQTVPVKGGIEVFNMVAQYDIFPQNYIKPIRYDALEVCLNELEDHISILRDSVYTLITVHMSYIGVGLAGGNWNIISKIIQTSLVDKGIDVYVYDFYYE